MDGENGSSYRRKLTDHGSPCLDHFLEAPQDASLWSRQSREDKSVRVKPAEENKRIVTNRLKRRQPKRYRRLGERESDGGWAKYEAMKERRY